MNQTQSLTDTTTYFVRRDAETVARFVQRHNRWMRECVRPNPNLRTMPSKDAKHRAYDAAASIRRELGITDRATCVEDLALTVTIAHDYVGGLEKAVRKTYAL